MKKILLAINGVNPRRPPFLYALQYCRVMRSGLFVLQILDPKRYLNLGYYLKYKARLVHQYLEDTMAAAALSESGNHDLVQDFLQQGRENIEQAILTECEQEVSLSLDQRIGDTRKEILSFLESRNDIALAVYDAPQETDPGQRLSAEESRLQRDIPFKLGIPLIMPADHFSRRE
ncbi:MAG: hypothetical protein K9J48_04055 [Desulfohalobiaceae bacterium]|nr:hypothetical protein [Desulfohalobiaceae bacterium]